MHRTVAALIKKTGIKYKSINREGEVYGLAKTSQGYFSVVDFSCSSNIFPGDILLDVGSRVHSLILTISSINDGKAIVSKEALVIRSNHTVSVKKITLTKDLSFNTIAGETIIAENCIGFFSALNIEFVNYAGQKIISLNQDEFLMPVFYEVSIGNIIIINDVQKTVKRIDKGRYENINLLSLVSND